MKKNCTFKRIESEFVKIVVSELVRMGKGKKSKKDEQPVDSDG